MQTKATRIFTNNGPTQTLLFNQMCKYLIEIFPESIPSKTVNSLPDLQVPNRTNDTDNHYIISAGYYDIGCDIVVKVTESEPVGLMREFVIYRTLSLTGDEKDLDLIIIDAQRHCEKDTKEHIRIYQSTYSGDWRSDPLVGYSTMPKRALSTVFLDSDMTDQILNDTQVFFGRSGSYKAHGIPYHRNYLITGPPGTGKTSLIHAIASDLDMGIAIINFHPYFDKESLVKCMLTLPKRTIVVVEDIDALYDPERKGDDKKNGLTFSDFINTIDGYTASTDGTLLFMTTNYPEKIDAALLRPGRVDVRLDLSYATKSQIQRVFVSYYNKKTDRANFEAFYDGIVKLGLENKLTMACLQNFFFRHLDDSVKATCDSVEQLLEYFPNSVSDKTPKKRKRIL